MKRRRRGLGSSAADHNSRAAWRLEYAEDNAKNVLHHVGNGACASAVNESGHMNTNYGQYLAERKGGGKPFEGSSLIQKAMDAIKKHCVR